MKRITDWAAARQVVDEMLADTPVNEDDRQWARSVLGGRRADMAKSGCDGCCGPLSDALSDELP